MKKTGIENSSTAESDGRSAVTGESASHGRAARVKEHLGGEEGASRVSLRSDESSTYETHHSDQPDDGLRRLRRRLVAIGREGHPGSFCCHLARRPSAEAEAHPHQRLRAGRAERPSMILGASLSLTVAEFATYAVPSE